MNWIDLDGKEYTDIAHFGNAYGFIYIIEHKETGWFYIGKKNLEFNRKKKLGKKELSLMEIKPGRRPTSKRVITESDWQDYWSSSTELKSEIKKQGKDKFKRTIIQLAYNSKQLTFFETKYQFAYNVLHVDNCWNNSILGKFSKRDFI